MNSARKTAFSQDVPGLTKYNVIIKIISIPQNQLTLCKIWQFYLKIKIN